MIVQLNTLNDVLKLRTICKPNLWGYLLAATALGLPHDCHMPHICRRVFSNTIFGIAGDFTDRELYKLSRCLPGGIYHKELDGRVYKAESDSIRHYSDDETDDDGAGSSSSSSSAAASSSFFASRRQLRQAIIGVTPNNNNNNSSNTIVTRKFEDQLKASGVDGAPIDLTVLAAGAASPWATGIKQQSLPSALWNLDRIDQRDLPLDNQYNYGTQVDGGVGDGVTIYVVDSGINIDHQEFKGPDGVGSRAIYGYDFVDDDEEPGDCDGHGTHVASTAVGLQVGVAKGAKVVAIRILDCVGSGSISDTVAGLDWVAANAVKPAVVTLSLGIQVGSWSRVLEEAVQSLINNHGITVVVASGNSGVDACYVAPSNVPGAITVAASNIKSRTADVGTKKGDPEDPYRWSNTGPCIDLWAPGVDILAACASESRCREVTNSSYTYASGTSMAAPQVAGVAALALSRNPDLTPADVSALILASATPNMLVPTNFKPGTPNRLLYSRLGSSATGVFASAGPVLGGGNSGDGTVPLING
jgi:subtilisin family serine protease